MKPKTTVAKFDSQQGAFNPGSVSGGFNNNSPTINPSGRFHVMFNDPKDGADGEVSGEELLLAMERINNGSRDKGAILMRMSFRVL